MTSEGRDTCHGRRRRRSRISRVCGAREDEDDGSAARGRVFFFFEMEVGSSGKKNNF
jgi:hypothetical protein